MVTLTIDGRTVSVPEGTTILEAAQTLRISIPTLCYLKDINEIGACRICMVEVEGYARLVPSCDSAVSEGMVVYTSSPRVREARRVNLRLLLSQHETKCTKCTRSGNCKLQQLTNDYNLLGDHYIDDLKNIPTDYSNPVVRIENRCVKCMRCIQVCEKIQGMGIWDLMGTGTRTTVGVAHTRTLGESDCTFCGQCITHCPVGGLQEHDDTGKVFDALANKDRITVVQVAPAVRVAWAEFYHLDPKFATAERMVTALKTMGFDYVFDTDFAADLTIMEEGTELLHRLKEGGPLPLITSCSPGWIKFCEHYYPEFVENLSSCKSPQQMFGALIKTYYAQKAGLDPKNIVVVSVMPCTAKKFEIGREGQSAVGLPDVDISITTRELADMIRRAGIMFNELPDEEFDPIFGIASGAGHIFGATGGVMEAALRTVSELVTGKELARPEFQEVRGIAGIKEAEYDLAGTKVRVAVTSGLANAAKLLDRIKSGEAEYHFVEVMACPGGCVNGGGQPHQSGDVRNFTDLRSLRAAALYSEDEAMTLRKSHENPEIIQLYKEYLGVEVPNDRDGCLQDSHWSGGSFGYFPSYALGNAYGAQMLHNMEQEFDVYGGVAHGDLSAITGWLREKVHQYGHLLEPAEVVRNACGTFDAHYYLDYLTKKYTELYNL